MKILSTLTALLCISLTAGAQYSLVKLDVNSQAGSGPARFTSFKDKTYFIADDGTHGYELWWSDGHSYGMVADINPGPASAFDPLANSGHNLCVWGNSLYFAARDSALGVQLWEYNGSSAPVLRTKLNTPNTVLGHVTAVQDKLYFKVASATGTLAFLYNFDPQTHAYVSVADPTFPANVDPMASVGGKLLFHGRHNNTLQLVEYDPATKSSRGFGLSPVGGFYVYKNALFFLSNSIGHGRELYTYDGFTWPRRITDIRPGSDNSFGNMLNELTERMTVYNNKLYFMPLSPQPAPFRHLYSYDPVADVVAEVAKVNSASTCLGMAVYGNKLFIATDSGVNQNPGLYVYDGSNLRHSSSLGFDTYTIPRWMAESNGRLYFSDWDNNSSTGFEPYVLTDSVALNVPDVQAGEGVNVYPNPAGNNVYFAFSLKQTAMLTVIITDVQGRLAVRVTETFNAGRNTLTVPMHRHASGVYTYTITNEEGEVLGQGKLVKQ